MEKLIDITSEQVAPYLDLLLKDKTTKRNCYPSVPEQPHEAALSGQCRTSEPYLC